MRAECIHPKELDAGLRQAWTGLRAANPAYASPYFHPRFAELVGQLRDDARILVISDGGVAVGFWGLHKRPDGFARPLGQPLADENGPILHPEAAVDLAEALRAGRIGAAGFTGAPSPPPALAPFVTDHADSARVDLSAGGAATLSALRAAHGTHFKTMRRKERKAIDTLGGVAFEVESGDRAALSTLVGWKRAQFARTGLYDVLGPAWTQALIESLAQETDPDFCGMLTTLRIGDALAAAEFSLRSGPHLHSWITAYDQAFSSVSPGHLMQVRMIDASDALGIGMIDIGVGAGHYKRFYANAAAPLAQGLVTAASLSGAVHGWRSRLWRAAEAGPVPKLGVAFGRLRRRTEIIVSADQSFSGRVASLMAAVRHAAAKAPAGEAAG